MKEARDKQLKQGSLMASILHVVFLVVIWAMMWPAIKSTGGTSTWYTDLVVTWVLLLGSWRVSSWLGFNTMAVIIYATTSKEDLKSQYGIGD